MVKSNKNILLKKAESYRLAVLQAMESKEYEKAKDIYLKASKVFLELAQHSEGSYKEAYESKANELAKRAEAISTKPDVDLPEKADEELSVSSVPDVSFDDVAGLEDVKTAIDTRIIKPRQHREVYKALRKKPGGGILMYGVPGTGKTMLAKAIANSIEASFTEIKCSSIKHKLLGESEKSIKKIFDTAREHQVAVLFFDEFESIGGRRTGNTDSAMNSIVPELLSHIDGFQSSFNTLLLIAATNRPWDIDSAFLRPGRFSEFLHIPLPDEKARRHIIGREFDGINKEVGVDFDTLAKQLDGFSGADVWEFCNKCKDPAADRCITEHDGDVSKIIITEEDVNETLGIVRSTVAQEDLDDINEFIKKYDKSRRGKA